MFECSTGSLSITIYTYVYLYVLIYTLVYTHRYTYIYPYIPVLIPIRSPTRTNVAADTQMSGTTKTVDCTAIQPWPN